MRRILTITALTLAALSLTACTASGRSASFDTATTDSGGTVAVAPGTAEGGKDPDAVASDPSRDVVTTGTARITADDPAAAAERAVATVEAAGGRIDAREQQAPADGDKGSASLTLRIPATKLTATIDSLRKLGTVDEIQLASDDVTRQSQDLDARITASRASVDRLLVLLTKATTTKDLIALESAISDRQGDLESMEAEQRSLADQVALSTLTVSFISVADAPAVRPSTFVSGIETGWSSFTSFISGVVVVLGVLLPWLVFAAVIGAVVLVIARRRRTLLERAAASDG